MFLNWGSTGHTWINRKSTESFPISMSTYMIWDDSLANHGSDADDRKSWDSNESMRHYIDIDNYSEFNSTGHIPSTYDSVVSAHGQNFVKNEGILPWSTKIMYDSLKLAFQQHNWHAAMLHASDLGHYVGDGHMPLHITKNFDGQNTNQSGIHSRYESDFVYNYVNYLHVYSGDTVHLINNVQQYIFSYLYTNYNYIDSVLGADTYAEGIAGNTTSNQYYQQFFTKAKDFTILLWHNASHSLAELIYTAWVEAGSPIMVTDINKPWHFASNKILFYPNPVSSVTTCQFTLLRPEAVEWFVFDMTGKQVLKWNNSYPEGMNTADFDLSALPQGMYYCVMQSQSQKNFSKILVSR